MTAQISKMHKRVIAAAQPDYVPPTQNHVTTAGIEEANKLDPNDFWDEANRQYQVAMDAINVVSGAVRDVSVGVADNPGAVQYIVDPVGLIADCQTVGNDISRHRDALETIHRSHQDRTGAVTTVAEMEQYFRVLNTYAEAADHFTTAVTPTAERLALNLGQALDKHRAAIDPAAVSDAVLVQPSMDQAIEQFITEAPTLAPIEAAPTTQG